MEIWRKFLDVIVYRVTSFTYLNLTQFLGSLNDNIYKFLITYFLINIEGVENSSAVMSIVGAVFVIPFLLFSGISGSVADRFSKSQVIILTKILEMTTMGIGLYCFLIESRIGSYCILFLMATQSALFSPCKYGILPEIVSTDKIMRANGLMSAATYLAIILGTFFATWMTDISNYNFVFSAIICVGIAFLGVLSSFFIEYTLPADEERRVTLRVVSDVFSTFKKIWYEVPAPMVLLTAIFSSAFFLFLGSVLQLNLVPYAVQSLGLTPTQGGYLFLYMAVGIGIGSFLSGKISKEAVEMGLVPFACMGIALGAFALDFLSNWPYLVYHICFITGIFGGLFLVPLDSALQIFSPSAFRGQVVASANFLSFVCVLLACLFLYVTGHIFVLAPDKIFSFMGMLTIIYTFFLWYQYFDFFTRFLGMCLCKLHFNADSKGTETLPDGAHVFVCHHSAWNDTLLILGTQSRRVRFFVEEEKEHSRFLKRLYRFLRIFHLPTLDTLEGTALSLSVIKKNLKRGISVCIFVENKDVIEEIERLKYHFHFDTLLEEMQVQIIPVHIRKIDKDLSDVPRWRKVWKKFFWPARVYFGWDILKQKI